MYTIESKTYYRNFKKFPFLFLLYIQKTRTHTHDIAKDVRFESFSTITERKIRSSFLDVKFD